MSRGYCSWLEDGEHCDTFGPLVKGLCRRHYDRMGHRLREQGHYISRKDVRPTVCTCHNPQPVQCRIIGGHVIVPDAWQCSACWRAVL